MLLCSSPIEFLLFLRPAAEERGTETKNRKVEDKNNKEGKNNREGKDDKAIRDIITAVAGAILCNVFFPCEHLAQLSQASQNGQSSK